jgi:hypothetical protein
LDKANDLIEKKLKELQSKPDEKPGKKDHEKIKGGEDINPDVPPPNIPDLIKKP